MATVLALSSSPSRSSRSAAVAEYAVTALRSGGVDANHLRLRELDPGPLLAADTTHPEIESAVRAVADADGILLATPTYKAAYSGLLKVFLDLLSQFAFAGKAVLPIATGGSPAHVLSLDYGLRPVVHSLGAWHVLQSLFVLDSQLDEALRPGEQLRSTLEGVLGDFTHALRTPSRTATIARSA
ncbi:NADPH-dependent FMN reductase [Sciscionella sediminilitoris]|uniref:NADPH-dependent FMN reductase n=1 Tax=Sciscionella sediminilitoris TaxID=1445613 RepID=UPI0004DF6A1E|nr:NADPH-dependent FMN reductase [Sciscionella sp. SE31]